MLWGFFMKVAIADRLAFYVNDVYNNLESYTSGHYMVATYFFAYQIYCDFAGYSLIAIGSAKVLGFSLMDNFRTPYYSKSISEFWKRWHISLSTWFRDYVYIPLGGNRTVKWRWYFNLFITFLVSGLWHGANWTFVVWGALHGSFLIAAIVKNNYEKKYRLIKFFKAKNKYLKIFITFHLALFAWIFFRANSLSNAVDVIIGILHFNFSSVATQNVDILGVAAGFLLIAILEIAQLYFRNRKLENFLEEKNLVIRYAIYTFFILIFLNFGVFHNAGQFIYFQF